MRPRLGPTVLVLLMAAVVFAVALQGVLSNGGLTLLDQPARGLFLAHRQVWLTALLRTATDLGSSMVLWPLVLAVGLVWRWRGGSWRPLVLLVAALLGVSLLTDVVKFLVGRPRPPALLPGESQDYSFPSGHTSQATAVFGMLAGLAATVGSRAKRYVAWMGAGLVVVVVGLSRIYLGRHWLTDVIGGCALGVIWLCALLSLRRSTPALPPHAPLAPAAPGPPATAPPAPNSTAAPAPPAPSAPPSSPPAPPGS